MKKNVFAVMLFSALALSAQVKAQNCDPWIKQAYNQLYQRNPSSEECNIRNYNNGSWNSYNELVGYIKSYKSKSQVLSPAIKGDTWIFNAYKELYGRQPTVWELNIQNYNLGSWSSYNDLKKHIQDFQNNLRKNNVVIKTSQKTWGDYKAVGLFINGEQTAADFVSVNGGQVMAIGGANMENIISALGTDVAKELESTGRNVFAVEGGTINLGKRLPGISHSDRYRVPATNRQIVKIIPASGQGALIVR